MLPMLLPLPTCLADPQELDVLPWEIERKKKKKYCQTGVEQPTKGSASGQR